MIAKLSNNKNQGLLSTHTKILAQQKASAHSPGDTPMGESSLPSTAMKGFELSLQNCKAFVLFSIDNALIHRVKAGRCCLLF